MLGWKPHCYKHSAMPTGSQEMSVKLWSIWNVTSLLTLRIKMNVLSASRMLTLGWTGQLQQACNCYERSLALAQQLDNPLLISKASVLSTGI